MGLHALRSEFRLLGYEGDSAPVTLAGIIVRRQDRRLAQADAADIGLVDIGAEPHMLDVGEREDWRTGAHDFPDLRLAHEDHTVDRRREARIALDDASQPQRFGRISNVRFRQLHTAVRRLLQRLVAFERRV